ncbi:MAG: outer membrane lipoprotein carrier protein LolA [Planctomycetota bacterium]
MQRLGLHAGMVLTIGVAVAGPAIGEEPSPPAADEPATPRLVVVDPELDATLERIEASADDLETLEAVIVYDIENDLTGDVQRRTGRFVYVKGDGPAQMAIDFDQRIVDGNRARGIDTRYVFDGESWVEIDGDEKRWTRYPEAQGQSGDPVTELLQLDFDKEELTKRYVVERRVAEDAGPDDPVTLRLRPRDRASAEFDYVDVTFDESLTPATVEAHDFDGGKVTRVRLLRTERNAESADTSALDTTPPTEPGWAIEDRSAGGQSATADSSKP